MMERQHPRDRALDEIHRLIERELGDIESYDLPAEDFDVVVCWNVFEHLPHPERAPYSDSPAPSAPAGWSSWRCQTRCR
jgi:Methyltransferase domain